MSALDPLHIIPSHALTLMSTVDPEEVERRRRERYRALVVELTLFVAAAMLVAAALFAMMNVP